jgi:hypothetical protein
MLAFLLALAGMLIFPLAPAAGFLVIVAGVGVSYLIHTGYSQAGEIFMFFAALAGVAVALLG